jgi:hypothetical protein
MAAEAEQVLGAGARERLRRDADRAEGDLLGASDAMFAAFAALAPASGRA